MHDRGHRNTWIFSPEESRAEHICRLAKTRARIFAGNRGESRAFGSQFPVFLLWYACPKCGFLQLHTPGSSNGRHNVGNNTVSTEPKMCTCLPCLG